MIDVGWSYLLHFLQFCMAFHAQYTNFPIRFWSFENQPTLIQSHALFDTFPHFQFAMKQFHREQIFLFLPQCVKCSSRCEQKSLPILCGLTWSIFAPYVQKNKIRRYTNNIYIYLWKYIPAFSLRQTINTNQLSGWCLSEEVMTNRCRKKVSKYFFLLETKSK